MKIWINRAGQNLGTFTLEEVQRGLDQAQFVPTDLAWQEGMENWRPLSEFPGLTIPPARPEPPPVIVPAIAPASPVVTTAASEVAPAWEQLSQVGFAKAFLTTFRQVLLEPGPTFARLPLNGNLWKPTGFFVAVVGIQLLISLTIQLTLASLGGAFSHFEGDEKIGPGLWASLLPLAFVILFPLLIGLNFLMAGIYHLLLTVLGGATKRYEGTYKVICYSQAAQIVSIVPCIGPIAAIVWYLIAAITGLQKVHQTEGWKAAVAILIPYIMCIGTVLAFLVFAIVQSQKELR